MDGLEWASTLLCTLRPKRCCALESALSQHVGAAAQLHSLCALQGWLLTTRRCRSVSAQVPSGGWERLLTLAAQCVCNQLHAPSVFIAGAQWRLGGGASLHC